MVKRIENNIGKILEMCVVNKKIALGNIVFLLMTVFTTPVFATATSSWNTVMTFILEWLPRLGAVVILIGAIEFALAFKSEDAEGKTKGIRTVVAGAMVVAIPVALGAIVKI